MRLIALTIARNESWCVGESLRAVLRWADGVVVINHASTDNTATIVDDVAIEHPGRVIMQHESDPVWHEVRYRQRSLEIGREFGGDFFAIIDADEMLTENLVPQIRDIAARLEPGQILQPPWIHCWRSLKNYRDDNSVWSRSWVSTVFRDSPELHWETRDIGDAKGYDFHHRHCFGSTPAPRYIAAGMGGLLHLQHANWERLLWKQLLYRLIEMVRWPEFGVDTINSRYGPTTDETNIHLTPIPPHWIPPELSQVDVGADPWQKTECLRLVKEHGKEYFAGIDFLGLDVA